MTNARAGVLSLALALCCGAAPVGPHLTIGAPWLPAHAVSTGGAFTTLAEWVLPDGTPHQSPRVMQRVWLTSGPLDERGLGGYVADQVGDLQRTPNYSGLSYSQIDSCLRPGWVATYDVAEGGLRRSFERVYFAFRDTLFVVIYVRPADRPIDPVAQAAMLSFCTSVPGRA